MRLFFLNVFKNTKFKTFQNVELIYLEWRKLHNEELNYLYFSPIIIRVIKSRAMRLAGHVACTKEKRNIKRVLVGKPLRKRPLGRSKGSGKIILRIIFRN